MDQSIIKQNQTSLRRERLRLTENAKVVLANRYLRKDATGKVIETPEQLFERVANHVGQVETGFGAAEQDVTYWQNRFYNLMASMRFLPNSPTLMNAGRSLGMLSACFVLPIPDSIDGIFDTVKHTAQIQKAGGGTGFCFDSLRPTGDFISSSGGQTSGPISFWKVLSQTTEAIQQGAFRRGANMGMMSLTHPDILKFLYAKQDLNAFTNYNISVKVTDDWMRRLQENPDSFHVVRNGRTGKEYLLPRSLDIWKYNIHDLVEISDELRVHTGGPEQKKGDFWTQGQIWQLVVSHAHQSGEPGVAFIDCINRDNPTPQLGSIEATNPCGEQPLLPYEACNLGSINLAKFVQSSKNEEAAVIAAATGVEALSRIDFAGLRETVHESVRFLDNVIESNNYQIEQIDQLCRANRKIGLGLMGFADALYKLAVPYNSEEGLGVGRELMRFINEQSHQASEDLAHQRGSFANWPGSIWDTRHRRPQRNAAVTTVAPTGTLSIIADCSGGVEPMFSVAFYRNILSGTQLAEINQTFKQVAEDRGFYSDRLVKKIAEEGTVRNIAEVPDDLKHVFVCAHDIAPQWHVRMQAAFQEHCDASISKTINFPHDATVEQVDQIYRLAFKLGCKGITVYRDGCRRGQPMSRGSDKETITKKAIPQETAFGLAKNTVKPITLPEIMSCVRVRQMTPFGNMHVKITVDPRTERELEVFSQLGKGGDIANSDLEAICRLLSLLLRCGGSFKLAIKQLDGIGSSLTIPAREGRIMSLGDGLAKAMAKYLTAKTKFGLKNLLLGEVNLAAMQGPDKIGPAGAKSDDAVEGAGRDGQRPVGGLMDAFKIKCPSCDGVLAFVEGCVKCYSCGFSQC